MLGFVFVIPPTWQAPQVALNNLLPRFTCSGVNTVVLPDPSTVTVRVASSKSMAKTFALNILNKHKKPKVKFWKVFTFTLGYLPEVFRFDNHFKLLWLIKLIENN